MISAVFGPCLDRDSCTPSNMFLEMFTGMIVRYGIVLLIVLTVYTVNVH